VIRDAREEMDLEADIKSAYGVPIAEQGMPIVQIEVRDVPRVAVPLQSLAIRLRRFGIAT